MKKLISLLIFLGLLTGSGSSLAVSSSHIQLPFTQQTIITPVSQVIPETLIIPKLGIKASIEPVSLDKTGAMDVPQDFSDVGWYEKGVLPGQMGSSVIDGHYDSYTGPAVFYKLNDLQVGDEIQVRKTDGSTLTFVVKNKAQYEAKNFPIKEVFGPSSKPILNLITCGGSFDHQAKHYLQRLVLRTELKSGGEA